MSFFFLSLFFQKQIKKLKNFTGELCQFALNGSKKNRWDDTDKPLHKLSVFTLVLQFPFQPFF